MKIELPKKVLFIINNLQLAGYDAFAEKTAGLGYHNVGKTRSNQGNISSDGRYRNRTRNSYSDDWQRQL